jgi:hypothetical protein
VLRSRIDSRSRLSAGMPPGYEGDAVLGADADDGLDLGGRAREDDGGGEGAWLAGLAAGEDAQ